ncbi:protein kinase [Ideonella sp. DXS29W]|uniref:Protein kinase n=1 Tax=Ideonella lacteola TaxID=2984193 RepID=A0ABU9BW10_9BURK
MKSPSDLPVQTDPQIDAAALTPRAAQLLRLARWWDALSAVDPSGRLAWIDAQDDLDAATRAELLAWVQRGVFSSEDTGAALEEGIGEAAAEDALSTGARSPLEVVRGSALAPGMKIGPYRLVALRGEGGMGSVWAAQQVDGGVSRRVALKLPHPWLIDGQWARRFQRERDVLAALEHPGIARLYDAGLSGDGQPWIAMELVDGQPFAAWCRQSRPSLRERLEMLRQVAVAVGFAHARGIVHRDLKPGNIMVSADGRAVLLDFGVAQLTSPEAADGRDTTLLTQAGAALMTPTYAAPEQVRAEPTGTATDVFALGLMLYEVVTGRLPYPPDQPTLFAQDRAFHQGPPARPSRSLPRLWPGWRSADSTGQWLRRADLDAVLATALEVDPSRRYRDGQALSADLQRLLAGERVEARPDTARYRLQRFVSRHLVLVASTVVLVVSLSAALVAVLRSAEQARAAAELAQREARTRDEVARFMEDLFNANAVQLGDPQRAQRLTARELLDAGARRIDEQLNDSPEVKLSMYRTLARMYGQLELGDEALSLAGRRLELARSLAAGAVSAEVIDASIDLARQLSQDSDSDEAVALAQEARRMIDAAVGTALDTPARQAMAEIALASALAWKQSDAAQRHIDRAFDWLDRQPDAELLRQALEISAGIQQAAGQLAREQHDLDRLRALYPPGTPQMIMLRSRLSTLEQRMGQRQASLADAQWAHEQVLLHYGTQSILTAEVTDARISALIDSRQWDEASRLLDQHRAMLDQVSADWGRSYRWRADGWAAKLALARGDLQAVERELDRQHQTAPEIDHVPDARSGLRAGLAGALAIEQGRYREAIEIAEAAQQRLVAAAGHRLRLEAVRARALMKLGDLQGADVALQRLEQAPDVAAAPGTGPGLPVLASQRISLALLRIEWNLAAHQPAEAARRSDELRGRLKAAPDVELFSDPLAKASLLACAARLELGEAARADQDCAAAERLLAEASHPRSPYLLEARRLRTQIAAAGPTARR